MEIEQTRVGGAKGDVKPEEELPISDCQLTIADRSIANGQLEIHLLTMLNSRRIMLFG
jgi:hypothetical protein